MSVGNIQLGKLYSNPYARAFKPQPVVEVDGEDHEVGMAQGQLDYIIKSANELKQKLGIGEKNIPGWIQDHISKAHSYLHQANSGHHELGESKKSMKLTSLLSEGADYEGKKFKLGTPAVYKDGGREYSGEVVMAPSHQRVQLAGRWVMIGKGSMKGIQLYGSDTFIVPDDWNDVKPFKGEVNEQDKSPEEILTGLKEMAMGDLERIEDYAEMIADRMKQGQELSSWMYSQITLAVDQLNAVHDAMDGKDGVKESELKGYLAADVVDDIVKTIGSKFVKGHVENAPNKNYIYLKLTDIKFGSGVVKMLKSQFGIDAKIDKTFGNQPTVSFPSNKVISEVLTEDADMNKDVKKFLDKSLSLRGMKAGSPPHLFAVKHTLIGALRDANFHSDAKKVPALFPKAEFEPRAYGENEEEAIDMYEYEIGPVIARICGYDGKAIVNAIGFYVSMTIGRPVGEKIQKLVEMVTENKMNAYISSNDGKTFTIYNSNKQKVKNVSREELEKLMRVGNNYSDSMGWKEFMGKFDKTTNLGKHWKYWKGTLVNVTIPSIGEGKSINEFMRPSDVDSKMKELGIKTIPISSEGERVLKGMVMEKFLDKVTNSERLIYFVESLGDEKFAYRSKGKPLSPLVDRFWNDITSEAIFFGGKMAAYQVAMNIKDMKRNGEQLDSPYQMMKEYFKNFGMDHDRSRVFDSAIRNLEEWMKRNKIQESVKEDIEPQTKKIASLTGTRADAVQQFVSTHGLNITKLVKFIEKGKLSDRMDFVSAIAGKPNNPIQKKIIKMFSEAVNEATEPEIITQLRDIVKNQQYQVLKDPKTGKKVKVDMQSANVIVKVYDALGTQNKEKFSNSGLMGMQSTAFKLMR